MNRRSINENPSTWDREDSQAIKITSLNCARLKPHFKDIKADHTLKKSDIIHLQETWLEQDERDLSELTLSRSYYHPYRARHIRVGRGKGITTYYTDKFHQVQDVVSQHYQITKYESEGVVSINVYRSAQGSTEEVVEAIERMEVEGKANIVTGDMNTCARLQRTGLLVSSMLGSGYQLLTKEATHTQGRLIDHAYIKNGKADLHHYCPYYSDHDGLCLTVEQVRDIRLM
jgi:exonuclease III